MSQHIKSLGTICAAFLISGCIEKEKIQQIPDAENILFTYQGDLLVSGGKDIYQIKASTDENGNISYSNTSVYDGKNCSFGGIAQSGDWAFSVCKEMYLQWQGFTLRLIQDTHLLAADLTKPSIEFIALDRNLDDDPMDDMAVPNGIGISPTGDIIIADTDFFAQSSVGRITLDYSNGFPEIAQFEPEWLDHTYGFQTPNGVKIDGNTLYVSDKNKVRRLYFDEAGEVPLAAFTNPDGDYVSNLPGSNVLYTGDIIVDDILPYCGGIAVTHFLTHKLVFQAASGEKYHTYPLSFFGPSALAIGQGQGFTGNDLMVTEKGVPLETNSNSGNRLSRVEMDFDLSDPLTCQAINELN